MQIVRFIPPGGGLVEAEVIQDMGEEAELKVIRPCRGFVMRVPKTSYQQEAELRIFRFRDGGAVAVFTTQDSYNNTPLSVEAGRKGLGPDVMETLYMSAQGYMNPSLGWKDVPTYRITKLYCAAEHIHFLRENVDLSHVRVLDLVIQGDTFDRQNVHLVPDYYAWDTVLRDQMRKVTRVQFHIRGTIIIPGMVWSWIYDGRFKCARDLTFESYESLGMQISEILHDEKKIRKIQDGCPLLKIGKREYWHGPAIMTYLMNKKLKGFHTIGNDVFKLFEIPYINFPPESEDVFPKDLLLLANYEDEPDPVKAMVDDFPPRWRDIYTNIFLPLNNFERVRISFEDAVAALSLGHYLAVREDILHIIATYCMNQYEEALDLLLDANPDDIRDFTDQL